MEFISLKKTIKVAQSLDTPVLLAVVRPLTNGDMPKKNKKSKTKIRASAAHGLTKGEKAADVEGIRPSKEYYNSKRYNEGNGGKGRLCGRGGIVQGARGVWGHIPGKFTLWTTSEENDRS